jgi:hypothetical protein
VTGNTGVLLFVGEKEMVGAVLVAEDPAAVVEGVFRANVLEADRALIKLRFGFRLLALHADYGFGHWFLRGRGL